MTKTNMATAAAQTTIINAAAEQATSAPATEISAAQRRLYSVMKSNIKPVGGKFYVSIPVELLFADYRYQRFTSKGAKKVRNLVAKWNPAKMDALRVSLHDEECKAAVINGMHRLIAAIILGLDMIECEVVMGLPEDPTERLKAEAHIFVTQNDEVDLLKPHQKHNAGVLLGTPEYVALDKMTRKHGIVFKKTAGGRGKCKAGELAGYSTALRIAKTYGENRIDNIFCVICESRWNLSRQGFSNKVLNAINNVLRLHPQNVEDIMAKCIEYMKPITPAQFMAESLAAYPERTETEQCTLYLEDYLCDKLGLSRVYLADKSIVRKSVATITPLAVVSTATESEAVSAS